MSKDKSICYRGGIAIEVLMGTVEWFVIGGIAIAAIDQILQHTPYKSNNVVQLVMAALKAVFRPRI